MENTILEIKRLTKYYGKVKAVEDLSLALQQGEIFGLIGPNGAGKSTTIRCVMNLINKTAGEVYFDHQLLDKNQVELKKQIGYLPSEVHLYEDLTVKKMLDYHEQFYQKDIHARRIDLIQRFQLDENKHIEDLSLGNLKKLGIVLAFMHQPKLYILDEPTSGLDPIMQNVFYQLLKEEKAKGNTILYSTHILSEVSKVCDRVGMVKDGKLLNVVKIDELHQKNLIFVHVISPNCQQLIKELDLKDYQLDNQQLVFPCQLAPNQLLRCLAQYDIKKLLIQEATLEDLFMHDYQ